MSLHSCSRRTLLIHIVFCVTVLLLVLVPTATFAEDEPAHVDPVPTETDIVPSEPSELSEEPERTDSGEQPVVESWREILQFGLDSEVIELLTTLKEQREHRLHGELVELFAVTINPRLKQRIIEFFTDMEFADAEPLVRSILLQYRDVPADLALAAIRYVLSVTENPDEQTRSALRDIADGGQVTLAETAIRAIGRRGSDDDIPMLMDRLTDRRSPGALRSSVILALGELKAEIAVDELIRIASDTSEEATLRQYAADSLGKIGDYRAIPVLTDLAGGSDTMLRAYAVNAIGYFEGNQIERILINALRDSFWRVRVSALQSVARYDLTDAIPAAVFRAERDPETRVRVEAFAALARMSDRRAKSFLSDYITTETNPEAMRITAMQYFLESDLSDNVAIIEQLIDQELAKPQSRILDWIGRIISTSDEPLPTRVYERFLDHPNFIMQIYGVRAGGHHSVASLRPRITAMSEAPYHQAVRRAAVDALARM